jgi:hypothetical protein
VDDEAFWTETDLGTEAEAAVQESLARLRQILDLAHVVPIPTPKPERAKPSWWQDWRSAALLIPAAAVLVFLLIQPTRDAERILLRDLAVEAVATVSEPSRTGTARTVGPGVLATGQAIALRFHLEQDAYVVVYHVDPAGAVQLVFPPGANMEPPLLTGGTGHVIPDPSGDESWILGTRTGQESFLVGVNSTRRPDSADLALSEPQPTADMRDRESIVADLMATISARMDQVQRIDVQHIE